MKSLFLVRAALLSQLQWPSSPAEVIPFCEKARDDCSINRVTKMYSIILRRLIAGRLTVLGSVQGAPKFCPTFPKTEPPIRR